MTEKLSAAAASPAEEIDISALLAEVETRLSRSSPDQLMRPEVAARYRRERSLGHIATYTHPNGRQEQVSVIQGKGTWGDVDPKTGKLRYDAYSVNRQHRHVSLAGNKVRFEQPTHSGNS